MSATLRQQLRTEWLKALRSDEFQQQEGVMRQAYVADEPAGPRDVMRHCCLGVLTEVAGRVLGRDFWPVTPNATLCPELVAMVGLRSDVGTLLTEPDEEGETYDESLADKNDAGESFPDIADFIEKHPAEVWFGPVEEKALCNAK